MALDVGHVPNTVWGQTTEAEKPSPVLDLCLMKECIVQDRRRLRLRFRLDVDYFPARLGHT